MKLTKENLIKHGLTPFAIFFNGILIKTQQMVQDATFKDGYAIPISGVGPVSIDSWLCRYKDCDFFPASHIKMPEEFTNNRKDVDDLINDKGWKPKTFTTFADMTGKPERPEKILCAAIEFENNMGKQLIGGATHELIEMSNQAIVYHGLKNKKYGFLTSWQRFVNSKEAYEIHMPKELIQSNYNNHIVGHLNPSDLL